MKRLLPVIGLLVLLLVGGGAAVALNPGEHVACATATVPAQTIAANGTAIGTVPGVGSVACTTATDQTVTLPGGTTTVTNTVTATSPTTTTSPPGQVLYGKSFEPGHNLYGSNSLEQPTYPAQPSSLGSSAWPYMPDFGTWYQVLQYGYDGCQSIANTSDNFKGSGVEVNHINNASPARCEMSKFRRVDAYTTDYYHYAFKLDPNWSENQAGGPAIGQFDYQSIDAAPLLLSLDAQTNSAYLLVNSGNCGNRSVNPTGCPYYSGQPGSTGYAPRPAGMPGPLYAIPRGALTRNVWHELVFSVYWTPTNQGQLTAWFRNKGDATWTKTVDVGPAQFAFPTLQIGNDGQETVTVDNINDPNHWPPIDKFGQYGAGVSNGTIYFDDWCRASSFDAAASC